MVNQLVYSKLIECRGFYIPTCSWLRGIKSSQVRNHGYNCNCRGHFTVCYK